MKRRTVSSAAGSPAGRSRRKPYSEVFPRLILLLEERLDTGGAPKASPIKCTETPTFELDILFRQNYSWQGRLRWTKGGKEAAFRSVLELLIQMETVLAQ